MNQIFVLNLRRLALGAALLALAAPSAAQQSSGKGIEEIVVTAQKTEQNVRDVPISMTVLGEAFLREKGVTDFHDAAIHAPNVTVDTSSSFPDVRIRGIGSPLSNKAFEQSVGLAIDGINYGRVPYFQGPLYDLDRVEILRGPQGTLFGKNVTAGLFNVVTKKPSDELTGYFSGELGQFDARRFEVAVGGPIWPKRINFRLSALTEDREGTVDNTTADVVSDARERMIERERRAIRVQLGVPDLFGGNLVVGYERVHFEVIGGGWEFRRVTPGELAFYRHFDPATDIDPENWRGSIDYPDFITRDIETYVANWSYPIRDWTLYAVAGHSELDVKGANDLDYSAAPMLFTKSQDKNPQTSFELRLASPELKGLLGIASLFGRSLGSSEITTGFFFERRNLLDSALAINLNIPSVGEFLVAQGVPTGAATDAIPSRPILPAGIALPIDRDLIDALTAAGVGQEESTGYFDQRGLALAGFTQLAWRPFERWSVETGLRYTWERKKAHFARRFTEGTGVAFNVLAGQSEFDVSRERSEGALTPQVAVRWSWTDDVNLFAKWATGYKAGGFNELNSNGKDGLAFKPERVTAWETGAKMKLLDDTAVLNVSLFWNDVTDMQVFTARPSDLVATVENAGKARARGVEVDAVWQPTPILTVMAGVGFDDANYIEFPFGECPMDKANTDGDADERCDLSGEPLYDAPKWNASLSPSLRVPFASIPLLRDVSWATAAGVALLGGMTGEYQDVHFTARSDDPRTRQPSFFRFAADAGIGSESQGWAARVAVKNLTEEAVAVQSRDVTLGQGSFVHILDEPRLVFCSFEWRW